MATKSSVDTKIANAAPLVSVKKFGAKGDGVTDDTAAFQAAIDSTTDGEIAVITVPSGSYAGALSTLSVGSRTVVWQELGGVSYVSSAPPGKRTNAKYLGDATRAWSYGHSGFADNTTSGDSADRPVVRIQRDANHTGGSTSVNASALSVQTTVNLTSGRVDNYENAYIGQVDSYRNDTTTGSPNISVFQGTCFKHNASTGGFFGANFVARDQTGRASSVSKGGLVGCEVDVVASGPDDTKTRCVLDVIARGYGSSVDGATSVETGIRVRPADAGVLSAEPVTIKYGVSVTQGTLGSVIDCFYADGGATGLLLHGTYTTSAIDTYTENLAVVRFGSKVNTPGTVHSIIALTGDNSSGSKVNYSKIQSVVQSNTPGSEIGRIDLIANILGSDTTCLQVSGTSGANPIFIRVSSALKQVTEGAADSGGTGYRVLRVPN